MVQISTFDQLLLMAYGELGANEAQALQEQLKMNHMLAKEWHDILRLTGRLDHTKFAPSETSLKIVLEHSFKTEHLQEI